MVKDKHIISEIDSFFSKNDCNRAINCIIGTISRLNLNFSGIELRNGITVNSPVSKCWNCFALPFLHGENSFQYSHSGLSSYFSCRKDMFTVSGTGPTSTGASWSIGCPCGLLRRTGARSDSEGSLQCLIIDDTDLPKTGFKTELIGRIYSHVLQEHPRLQGAVPVPYRREDTDHA